MVSTRLTLTLTSPNRTKMWIAMLHTSNPKTEVFIKKKLFFENQIIPQLILHAL